MNSKVGFETVFSKLQNIKEHNWGWSCNCPVHEAGQGRHSRSLSLGIKAGKLLVKCHKGCSFEQIVSAAGLDATDFFVKERRKVAIEKTYDYIDENGDLLYQVVRFSGKEFRQRRPKGDGDWDWGLGECRRILYRLPELIKADPNRRVMIPEGEKDVDRLIKLGFVATTSPMGAGRWKPEYAEFFRGRQVVVIPDRDPIDEKLGYSVGEQHARDVVKSLVGIAESITILRLEDVPEKGDVSDWLDRGHTRAELIDLVKNTEPLYPVKEQAESAGADQAATQPEIQPEQPPENSATCCGIIGEPEAEPAKQPEVQCEKQVAEPGPTPLDMAVDCICKSADLLRAKKNLTDEDRRYLTIGVVYEAASNLARLVGGLKA